MKISLSYKFTGENYEELKKFLDQVCNALKNQGHEPSGTYMRREEFEKNKTSLKEIMLTALRFIEDSDCHVSIINFNEKSEGMLLEIGYAYAKNKRMIVAIKKGIKTIWLKEIIPEIIEYENLEDLCIKLKKLK